MQQLSSNDFLELSLPSECSICGGVSGYGHLLRVQEDQVLTLTIEVKRFMDKLISKIHILLLGS